MRLRSMSLELGSSATLLIILSQPPISGQALLEEPLGPRIRTELQPPSSNPSPPQLVRYDFYRLSSISIGEANTMSQHQPYVYRPLDQSRREIRLITILNVDEIQFVTETIESDPVLHNDSDRVRGIEEDIIPVRCTIQAVSLEDKPAYTALSYTWGDAHDKRRIVVLDGQEEYELRVTENLLLALRRIVLDGQVWIDAICINQADDVEKSWQVQQMWSIFHEAQNVAVWVGLMADESDLVLEQMAAVPEMAARYVNGYPSFERQQRILEWRPSADFLSVSTFHALQELQASQNVWLHVGRRRLQLGLVNLVLDLLYRMHADHRRMKLGAVERDSFEGILGFLRNDENFLIARAAIKAHGSKSKKGTMQLAELLKGAYIFRKGLDASDPRDLIFAFVGMSTDAAALQIVPNYAKNKTQVFAEVAMALIKQIGLEVLTWCKLKMPPEGDCPLPSWAPDWSSLFPRPLGKSGTTANFGYAVSRNSVSQFRFIDSGNEFPILCASGIEIDSIGAVGKALPDFPISDFTWLTNDQDPHLQLQLEWLSDIEQLSKRCGNVYSSEALEDAIWRTPITDMEFTFEGEYRRANRTMQKGYLLYRTGFLRASMPRRELERRSDDIRLVATFWRPMVSRSAGRKYFVSNRGYLGVGPSTTLPGDIIAIILGLDTPLVLRAVEKDCYRVVGEAYVHGVMDGELMKDSAVQEFKIS